MIVDASEDYAGVGKSVEIKNIADRRIISGLHTFLLREKKQLIIDGYKGYLHKISFVNSQMNSLASGSKVYGVNKANLRGIAIPYSINTIEQQVIAKTLSNMDSEIEILEKKVNKYKLIKQGMMQNLLTGKIRLI